MHNSFDNGVLSPLMQIFSSCADLPAFFIGGKTYTYHTLGCRTAAIRQTLQRHSCHPGQRIALAVNDDLDTYASIIALWLEGCAYVPLHPLQPIARNLEIIRQTQPALILHSSPSSTLASEAARQGFDTVCTAQLDDIEDIGCDPVPTPDESLAYILFTSGSTGTPKGVCISRGNVAAFIESFWKTGITVNPADRCLQAFDLTFDVSIQAFLTALLGGACVYTIPYGQVKYLYAAQLIIEQRITHAAMAPSMLTYLRPYFSQLNPRSLKVTILTAEACPIELAEAWFACATQTDIYDFYGPTEGTIYCTCHRLKRHGGNPAAHGMAAIGRPLANVTAILVDENGNPVPKGEKGELCIAGRQVTPGYWNNEQKNTTAFFSRREGDTTVRYYHTGDLCQLNSDGNILYYGRLDQQTKIQGYRVELGEIEYHARQFSQHRAVATAYTNQRGLTEIALFVETAPTDTTSLSHYLAEQLPHYMLPSQIVCVPEFPLNKSEKIDRPALAKLLDTQH